MGGGFTQDVSLGGFQYATPAGGAASIGGVVGGGTQGSVLYVGAGGALAQDNANFFYDDTDHQLVLGAGTAPKPSLILGDDASGLYRVGADAIGIATAGVGRWQVSATGQLLAITDASFDIGAPAATRPRHLYASGDIYAGSSLRIGSGATASLTIALTSGIMTHTPGVSAHGYQFKPNATVATSGAAIFFRLTPEAATGQTLSTEINGFAYDTFTRQWATGALATQREFVVSAPTYAFVGASTITTAATLYVSGAPIAGANATITTAHAAWFGAKIRVDAAVALGGGGAPTFGTIGGTGPAAAAQNEWIEIHTQNGKRFVPAWA
jgi:hypothetical protein